MASLAKFLKRYGERMCISPDFGETTFFCEEYWDHLGTSDDPQDRQLLRLETYTMEGQNGTQVYVTREHESDLMIGVLEEPTPVLFRKFKGKDGGDVIAIMPTISEGSYTYRCYQHVGQHGACDRGLVHRTTKATEEEYKSLKKELEDAPYHYRFKVIQRWPAR